MKKKGLIAIYSLMSMIIVGLVITVVVLAATTQYVGSSVSILYVATEISGSVTATYQIGSNDAKSMTDSEGNTSINFGSDLPTSILLLSPNETLTLGTKEDVLLTYTFNNSGETYYATVSYADTDSNSPSKNLDFQYKTPTASKYDDESSVIEVPSYGSATYIIKISVHNIYSGASLNGRVTWALTKEKPKTIDDYVALNIANNGDSSVNSDNIQIVADKTTNKFKIVGAVPESAGTTTSSGNINGSYNNRNAVLDAEKGLMSVAELTNSSTGAEFFYFCTNPEVVGNTAYGYIDPGTIYWTSTSDTTLESWYDIPTEPITLYSCFMKPNFTGAEVDSDNCYNGTATQIVISNSVENILYRAFYHKSTITNVAIPQSVKNIGYGTSNTSYGALSGCSKLTRVDLPNSVTALNNYAFSRCSGLTSIKIPDSVKSIGGFTFASCSGLASITMYSSLKSIGRAAFLTVEYTAGDGRVVIDRASLDYVRFYGTKSEFENLTACNNVDGNCSPESFTVFGISSTEVSASCSRSIATVVTDDYPNGFAIDQVLRVFAGIG